MFGKGLASGFTVCAISLAAPTALAGPDLAGPVLRAPHVQSAIKPVAVFGEDNRVELPDKYSALEGKIGMLYEQSTQTLCTAFCVGEGLVATAAHCLFQPKNNQLPNLDDVTFRLSYGTALRTSGIAGRNTPFVKNYVAVGSTSFSNEPPLSAPKDWAILKLERPICTFGSLKMEPMTVPEIISASQAERVFQVAYHWDFVHWHLAYSKPCRVTRDFDQIKWRFIRQHFSNPDELVLHTCDTGGASSGSPILLDTATMENPRSAPVAVGINVGTYTRTRILLRQGRIVKRMKPDIIANTGVNALAFNRVIDVLGKTDVIASHDEMLKLQSELHARGFYSGALDGHLGRNTRTAILNFESANGLIPTGLPSQMLLRHLGEDQVKPSHLFSTGSGDPTEMAPPLPTRKGALPVARKARSQDFFDPFKLNP